MAIRTVPRRPEFDLIEPIGRRIVLRTEETAPDARAGAMLAEVDDAPVTTGKVVAISRVIENDPNETIRPLDVVLFDPRDSVPVEMEPDARLFIVKLERVLAIFRRSQTPSMLDKRKMRE